MNLFAFIALSLKFFCLLVAFIVQASRKADADTCDARPEDVWTTSCARTL